MVLLQGNNDIKSSNAGTGHNTFYIIMNSDHPQRNINICFYYLIKLNDLTNMLKLLFNISEK